MKYCPYCGKSVQANDRFCLECGSVLDSSQHDDTIEKIAESEAGDNLSAAGKCCRGCGLPVADDDAFCQECGMSLDELNYGENNVSGTAAKPDHSDTIPIFCGQCGASMQTDDLFCPDCGAVVNGDNNVSEGSFASTSVELNSTYDDNESAQTKDKDKRKLSIWIIIVVPLVVLAAAAAWYFLVGFGENTDKPTSESAYTAQGSTVTSNEETTKDYSAGDTLQTTAQNNAADDQSTLNQEPIASVQHTTKAATSTSQQKTPESNNRTSTEQKTKPKTSTSSQPKTESSASAAKAVTTTPKAKTVVLFSNWNDLPVKSNPTRPVRFEIDRTYHITSITTKHFNDGNGVKPGGTISIVDEKRILHGTFTCNTMPDKSGTPDALWVCYPNITLPVGKYKIVNSGEKTWSFNLESGRRGLIIIEGKPIN